MLNVYAHIDWLIGQLYAFDRPTGQINAMPYY